MNYIFYDIPCDFISVPCYIIERWDILYIHHSKIIPVTTVLIDQKIFFDLILKCDDVKLIYDDNAYSVYNCFMYYNTSLSKSELIKLKLKSKKHKTTT